MEVDREVPQAPETGTATPTSGKEILIVWVPDELFKRLPDEDRRKYERVEGRPQGTPTEEDGELCWVGLCSCATGQPADSRLRVRLASGSEG